MKYYFTLGGLVGFSLTFANSLLAGSDPNIALRDAAIGCLVVAMLFRWLRGSMISNVTVMLRERERALAASQLALADAPASGSAGGMNSAPALG